MKNPVIMQKPQIIDEFDEVLDVLDKAGTDNELINQIRDNLENIRESIQEETFDEQEVALQVASDLSLKVYIAISTLLQYSKSKFPPEFQYIPDVCEQHKDFYDNLTSKLWDMARGAV